MCKKKCAQKKWGKKRVEKKKKVHAKRRGEERADEVEILLDAVIKKKKRVPRVDCWVIRCSGRSGEVGVLSLRVGTDFL